MSITPAKIRIFCLIQAANYFKIVLEVFEHTELTPEKLRKLAALPNQKYTFVKVIFRKFDAVYYIIRTRGLDGLI